MDYIKKFYDRWDGTARLIDSSTCTECGATNVRTVQFMAEINAGEEFDVNVCRDCLIKYTEMIK